MSQSVTADSSQSSAEDLSQSGTEDFKLLFPNCKPSGGPQTAGTGSDGNVDLQTRSAAFDRTKAAVETKAAQSSSVPLAKAKGKFSVTLAKFDILRDRSDFAKATDLLSCLEAESAEMLRVAERDAQAASNYPERVQKVQDQYDALIQRAEDSPGGNGTYRPRYQEILKPIADLKEDWEEEAKDKMFADAIAVLKQAEDAIVAAYTQFDKIGEEWKALDSNARAPADAEYVSLKQQYEQWREKIDPDLERINERIEDAEDEKPEGRGQVFASEAHALFAINKQQSKYSKAGEYNLALELCPDFGVELRHVREKFDDLSMGYYAAAYELQEAGTKLNALSQLAKAKRAELSEWPALGSRYELQLGPLVRKEKDLEKLDPIEAQNRIESFARDISDMNERFKNLDAMTVDQKDDFQAGYEVDRSEWDRLEQELEAKFEALRRRIDEKKDDELQNARYLKYVDAYRPAQSSWYKLLDSSDARDFETALKGAKETRSKLDDAKALFDGLDREWPELESNAVEIAGEVLLMTQEELHKLDPRRKTEMMRTLAAVDTEKGSKSRLAQFALLQSMQMDEKFEAKSNKQCNDVSEALTKDPTLKDAKSSWGVWSRDDATRAVNFNKLLKVAETILKTQSDILRKDLPELQTPKIKVVEANERYFGNFDNKTKTININRNSKEIWDLKELINTVTHENTHNYQHTMIEHAKKFKDGDDDYDQLLMFQVNDDSGYVDSAEAEEAGNYKSYKRQPMERHAFQVGGKIAKDTYDKL
jgi:hypothetical protein